MLDNHSSQSKKGPSPRHSLDVNVSPLSKLKVQTEPILVSPLRRRPDSPSPSWSKNEAFPYSPAVEVKIASSSERGIKRSSSWHESESFPTPLKCPRRDYSEPIQAHLPPTRVNSTIPIVQMFCDKDFRLLRVNCEAEEILGYDEEQLSQMSLYDIIQEQDYYSLRELNYELVQEEIGGCNEKVVVSNVHPSFYMNAPPAMLTMAAPDSSTFEMDTFVELANGLHRAYRLRIFRSGAFCTTQDDDQPQEAQLYYTATLVKLGHENRLKPRTEFKMPLVIDLSQDPRLFTNRDPTTTVL